LKPFEDDRDFSWEQNDRDTYYHMAESSFKELLTRLHAHFGQALSPGKTYDIKDLEGGDVEKFGLGDAFMAMMEVEGNYGIHLEKAKLFYTYKMSVDMGSFFAKMAEGFQNLDSAFDAYEEDSSLAKAPKPKTDSPKAKPEPVDTPSMIMTVNGELSFDTQFLYPLTAHSFLYAEIVEDGELLIMDAKDIMVFKKVK
jgi:hypothetical protein